MRNAIKYACVKEVNKEMSRYAVVTTAEMSHTALRVTGLALPEYAPPHGTRRAQYANARGADIVAAYRQPDTREERLLLLMLAHAICRQADGSERPHPIQGPAAAGARFWCANDPIRVFACSPMPLAHV